MRLYTIEFMTGSMKHSMTIKAKNKMEAVNEGYKKCMRTWREKDSVDEIRIIELEGQEEATADDYRY